MQEPLKVVGVLVYRECYKHHWLSLVSICLARHFFGLILLHSCKPLTFYFTIRFEILTAIGIASLAAAALTAVIEQLEKREVISANELTKGAVCKGFTLIFARGAIEPGNIVRRVRVLFGGRKLISSNTKANPSALYSLPS